MKHSGAFWNSIRLSRRMDNPCSTFNWKTSSLKTRDWPLCSRLPLLKYRNPSSITYQLSAYSKTQGVQAMTCQIWRETPKFTTLSWAFSSRSLPMRRLKNGLSSTIKSRIDAGISLCSSSSADSNHSDESTIRSRVPRRTMSRRGRRSRMSSWMALRKSRGTSIPSSRTRSWGRCPWTSLPLWRSLTRCSDTADTQVSPSSRCSKRSRTGGPHSKVAWASSPTTPQRPCSPSAKTYCQ